MPPATFLAIELHPDCLNMEGSLKEHEQIGNSSGGCREHKTVKEFLGSY